ncbi:MAG: electron transfer flavoprotein subunit alpha/FixB family protein [Oscillospiraceae bacterium]|nr:electron transfer flavoprotein subunit alpha/FixB family protein [Oscillospiraceae bacterium]
MAKEDYKGIWVFAEQEHGVIEPTVFELLGKAQDLQAYNKEEIVAVLLGNDVDALAADLIARGANKVIVANDPALAEYSARPYQAALTQLVEKYKPSILLYGATPLGRDLAPRLMITLDTGLTADAIDLGFGDDGVFVQTTPAYGGKILAHIMIPEKRPQMATVHCKMFAPLDPDPARTGEVIKETVTVSADPDYQVVEFVPDENVEVNLAASDVIVAGGRGVKSEDDLKKIEELAELLGGQVGVSRPLVDNGWMPHSRQIGQSGVTVTPRLMLNLAVSGSVQYTLGMQKAGCIVVVNTSEDAPIFDFAHYGIVGDYKQFVPALIEELKNRKA